MSCLALNSSRLKSFLSQNVSVFCCKDMPMWYLIFIRISDCSNVCVCIDYALCNRFFVRFFFWCFQWWNDFICGYWNVFTAASFILSVSVSHITSRVCAGAFVIFVSGSVSNSALKPSQFARPIENLDLLDSSIRFVFILMCMGMWSDACVWFSSVIWWARNKNCELANIISGLPLLVPEIKCIECWP